MKDEMEISIFYVLVFIFQLITILFMMFEIISKCER